MRFSIEKVHFAVITVLEMRFEKNTVFGKEDTISTKNTIFGQQHNMNKCVFKAKSLRQFTKKERTRDNFLLKICLVRSVEKCVFVDLGESFQMRL